DLRRIHPRPDDSGSTIVDLLVAAGYRSMVSVRAVAQSQVMRLMFFSRHASAYTVDDVPGARHVADYVAVAVAHEQLASVGRDRAAGPSGSPRASARWPRRARRYRLTAASSADRRPGSAC